MPETTHLTQQDEGLRRTRSLPAPSYAAQLLTEFATQLDSHPADALTPRAIGTALAAAMDSTLRMLPLAVQGAVAIRALGALPQLAPGEWITCGEYALRLRAAAVGL
ncbi:hypothetical protein ACFV0C_36955 [Streptomyces sp. NPDC059568]|uniref:hypothetical protein n=1 Tax=Streptomyces sp. NPDC059568 TaxID=3346868 RepID=UPI0036CBE164